MTHQKCQHAASGCNYPEGECAGMCRTYKPGSVITCKSDGHHFAISRIDECGFVHYKNASERGVIHKDELLAEFLIGAHHPNPPPESPATPTGALNTQVGGDHYKKLGNYQPWEVLKRWLTPEEFKGYMKGTAIAYLAREVDKGGMQDIEKAAHTLAALVELK